MINTNDRHTNQEDTTSSKLKLPRDPAASMSLLTQILMNPMDAGYTRIEGTHARSRIWHKLIVFVAAIALGLGISATLTSLRAPTRVDVVGSLTDQVREQADSVMSLDAQIAQLRHNISAHGGGSALEAEAKDPLTQLNNASAPVTGAGIRITITESQPVGLDSDRHARGRVKDQDLRMIVNALWAGRADAISINGIRLGPGSFVRTAGQSIIVNVTPIQPPYIIEAIGNGPHLSVAVLESDVGDYLSSVQSAYGISMNTSLHTDLQLPSVDLRELRYSTWQEDTQ